MQGTEEPQSQSMLNDGEDNKGIFKPTSNEAAGMKHVHCIHTQSHAALRENDISHLQRCIIVISLSWSPGIATIITEVLPA